MFTVHVPKIIIAWLPFAALATVLCLVSYVMVQQNIRLSANDPQIQIAEDVAAALENGQPTSNFSPQNKVDMAKSLDAFAIIYDADGKVVAGSGAVDGKIPEAPKSSLDYAQAHGDNRLTWEPKSGVRSAVIIKPYSAKDGRGFVLVGKSLREIEARERQVLRFAGLGWVVALFVSLFFVSVKHYYMLRTEGESDVEVVVVSDEVGV